MNSIAVFGSGTVGNPLLGLKGAFHVSREFSNIQIIDADAVIIACGLSGLANVSSEEYIAANVTTVENILAHVNSRSKIIHISSTEVLSHYNSYSTSKLKAEQILHSHFPDALIIRIPSLIGDNCSEKTIIPRMVKEAVREGVLTIWGSGINKKKFLFVDDFVSFIEKICQEKFPLHENIFTIYSLEVSFWQLSTMIRNRTGCIIRMDYGKNIDIERNDSVEYSVFSKTDDEEFVKLDKFIQDLIQDMVAQNK